MRWAIFFVLWMSASMGGWYLHRRLDRADGLTPRQVRTRRVIVFVATVLGLMLVLRVAG